MTISLQWQEPLQLARRVAGDMCLLHSGMQTNYSGGHSYLACTPVETLENTGWEALRAKLSRHGPALENAWFGYFGYGLKNTLENLPTDAPDLLPMPDMRFTRYATIFHFDHETRSLARHGAEPDIQGAGIQAIPPVAELSSNMSKREYMAKVEAVLQAIEKGEVYQANLTRKFHGCFNHAPDAFSLFAALCEHSPAPYSSLIRWGGKAIISSSPECFLTLDAQGHAFTRPIKGSSPLETPAEALAASQKNRAENLMIVDLMRNDFSRICTPGSVRVERLFEVDSFRTLRHMASEVHGELPAQRSPLDLVQACFPPGSMTGAPKIRAMQLCAELEPQARGVYSGALGWFGGDGSMDFSVIIRTLLLDGANFQFQVGGGIVADSSPLEEWQETLTKAAGIAGALGISRKALEGL